MTTVPASPTSTDDDALHAAFRRLLAPLATLAVSRGVTYASLDEWLRTAFVAAAYESHPDLPPHRRASRVSAATGLHRREVQRLLAKPADATEVAPSRAAEVFAHWRSDADYRERDGTPRVLPRTGSAPSFETLAHSVTRDVHPRALLEELLRLKLAEVDPHRDTVALTLNAFVPTRDLARMAGFLADNVGDHLQGAVENVLGGRHHFEQAIFAEGLSEASVAELRTLVLAQWKLLTDAVVPALEGMIERDRASASGEIDPPNATANQRVRVGLYDFTTEVVPDAQRLTDVPSDAPEAPPVRPTRPASPRRQGKTS